MKYLAIALLLSGCGVDVHVDPIKAEPVQVVHTLNINFDFVNAYCNQKCSAESQDVDAVKACATACYVNFIDILTHGIVPTGAKR